MHVCATNRCRSKSYMRFCASHCAHLLPRSQQERAHGGGQADADRRHIRSDVAHGVKHRHACNARKQGQHSIIASM